MGDQVRHAAVVALGDARPAEPTRSGTILTLREIIKGDPSAHGGGNSRANIDVHGCRGITQ